VIATLVVSVALTDTASARQSTLSAKQWRARADALCRHADRRTAKVRHEAFRGLERDQQPSLAQMSAYVKGISPIMRDLLHDIDALREPKKLATKVDRFLSTARRELRRLVADPSLGLEANPFSDSELRAAALALKACP
jgi:hypothetical protein